MTYVRLTKRGITENANYETPDMSDYTPGKINYGKSTPIDYTVEGFLYNPAEVGKSLQIFRKYRNGVEADGILTTSTIQSIESYNQGPILTTRNSVYYMEFIHDTDVQN